MSETISSIIKTVLFSREESGDINQIIFLVVLFIGLLILYEYIRSYFETRRERRELIKTTREHNLNKEERNLILTLAAGKTRVDPRFIFGSIREFHRFFGPLMHELSAKAEDDPILSRKLAKIFLLRKKLFGEIAYHFGVITNTVQLENNQALSMEFTWEDKVINASTAIMDIDETAITVANHNLKGEFIRFTRGDEFKVSFFREKDGYYQFKTIAARDVDPNCPLFLFLSHAEKIHRIQSRKFYRLETVIPFKFTRYAWNEKLSKRYRINVDGYTGQKQAEQEGKIRNISAGGFMFHVGDKLTRGDMLLFNLQLEPENVILDLLGKVVGVEQMKSGENQFRVHLNFLNIKPIDQESIVNMIQQSKLEEED